MFISFKGSFSVSNTRASKLLNVHINSSSAGWWISKNLIKNKVIFNQKLKTISWCGSEAAGVFTSIPPLFSLHPGRGCGPPTPPPPHPACPCSAAHLFIVHFVKFEPAGWSIIIKYNYLFSPIVYWSISCWHFYLHLQFSSLTFILEKDRLLLSSSLSAPLHHIFTLNFLEIISFSSLFFLFFFVCADGFCLLLLLFSFPSSACRSTPRSLGGLRPWRPERLWKTCLASCLTVRSSQRKFLTKVMKISQETKAKEASDNWRLLSVNHRTQERTMTADWTFTDGDDRLRWLGFRDNWISEAVASETGKTSPNLFVSRSQRSLTIERETI